MLPAHGRVARNTAIFSIATGLSRVAGLAREIVARSYFGTTGAASAFTLAFQIPNLIRALVADAALTSAFVPVFSDLLEHKRRREALHLAASLAGLILVALGALTLVFIAVAPWLMPLFTSETFSPALDDLTVGLSRLLFPIVILLGLTGLVVGILNAYDHFSIPAIAPLVWNLVIIGGLVVLTPLFEGDDRLYAYAIGVVAGTAVQLLMCLPPLRRIGFPLRVSFSFRDPRIKRVLVLMLPVSVGLGLINITVVLNSVIGLLVTEEGPSAIDAAFRLYMLPQGMFSVAVATVLFPRLARLASRHDLDGLRATTGTGMRQIALLLIPSAAATVALATPIVQLVYRARRVRRRVHAPDLRGAAVVRVLPALLGHQPAAHPDVLLAAAAVAADRARAGLAGGQRRRLARAVRTARARRRRAGDDGGQRRDDGAAGDSPAAGARRPGGGRAPCGRRRSCWPRPRCSAASPTARGG